MLRESTEQNLNWTDKTMSMTRARLLDACEQRLAELPYIPLFGESNDHHAEMLWRISCDALEKPQADKLHTMRDLQAQVLIRLPVEAALLTEQEEQLVDRLVSLGGQCKLFAQDDVSAAESLVRRLWCTVEFDGDEAILTMPQELVVPLVLVLDSRAHQELRAKLMAFSQQLRAVLYLNGLVYAEHPLALLRATVLQGTYADDEHLAMRYLRNAFDYSYDKDGNMLLLHPGLTDPERLLMPRGLVTERLVALPRDEQITQLAANDMLPEEHPLMNRLLSYLHGAVRPDVYDRAVADDLRMLAKQGVSLESMNEVLSAQLMVHPTKGMLDSVR